MYVSNRKHAFKVLRRYKNGKVKLMSVHGTITKPTAALLEKHGYRFTKTRPAIYRRGV